MNSYMMGEEEIVAALVHGPNAIMLDGIGLCGDTACGTRRVTKDDLSLGQFAPIEMGLQAMAALALQGTDHRVVAVLNGWLKVDWGMPQLHVGDMLRFEFPKPAHEFVNGRDIALLGAVARRPRGFTFTAGTTLVLGPDFNSSVEKCRTRALCEQAVECLDQVQRSCVATLWEGTSSRAVVGADVRDHFCRRYGLAEIVPGFCLVTWAWQAACNCLTNKGLQPIPWGEMKFKFGVPAVVGQTVVTHVRVMRDDWNASTGIGVCKVKMEANGHTLMCGSFGFQNPSVRQLRRSVHDVRGARQLVGVR